jgi:hypothetical protein
MDRFVLQNTFVKVYMLVFNKYFYKNKKSKLCIGDRIVNDMLYEYGRSNIYTWLAK